MEKVEKVKKPRKPINKKLKIIIPAVLAVLCVGLAIVLFSCSSCGDEHKWGDFKVTQEPTCAVAGKQVHTCKVCRKSEAEDIETLAHTYQTVWESGESRHWYECEVCGGKCEAEYHSWGDWEVVEEPTCTETGIKKRICKTCDKEDIFKIEKLGHVAEEAWSRSGAKHYHLCTVCGGKVQVAAHAYETWTKVKDATVNTDGSEVSTCKECGYRGSRAIEKTGAKSLAIKGGKSVTVGGTLQLSAVLEPADLADKSVTWSSAKKDIATVNANGTVTGLKPGSTRIIATAANGKKISTVVWVTESAIDGNLNDGIYKSLTPFVWNQTDVNVGENIRLYFGADGLYIADQVSDAKVKQNGDKSHIEAFLTLSNVFKGVDSIGIRFYPNGYSETGAIYRTYVYDYKGANENYHWSERKDAVILEMDAAVQYTSNGYNVEAFIPWGTLGLTKAPASMHYMSIMQAVFEGTDAKMRYGTYETDVEAYKQVHAYDTANYIEYDKKGFVHREVCTDKEAIVLGNNFLVNQKYTTEFKLNKMNDLNLLTGATFKGTGAQYISEVGNGVYKIAVPYEKRADFETPQVITIVDGRNIGKTFTLQLVDAFMIDDLAITFNGGTTEPVLYGTSTKLDMTLFGVTTEETADLSYNWSMTYNGEAVTGLDMTSKGYAFANAGTYVLTAEIATPGYVGSASIEIHVMNPDVYVSYANGNVANTGTNTSIKAGAYVMDALKNATKFVATNTVSYTTGRSNDSKGAMVTNHYKGAYTVVKNYPFGKNDFTVSTWFMIPTGAEVAEGSGTCLLGIDHPDTKTGFAVNLKRNDKGETELRVRVANASKFISTSYNKDTWYNLSVSREGSSLKVYFDGTLVGTYDIGASCDYGTRDLAFGAYHGVSWAYKDANTYYDDIQVYKDALTEEQIQTIAKSEGIPAVSTLPSPKVRVNYTGGAIANSGTETSIKAGSYVLDKLGGNAGASTKFEATNTVSYTTGRDGDANGAMVTNHYKGAYTVVKNYPFGKNDFTISTWFNLPTDAEAASGAGTCLLGIDHPDTTTMFAISLKAKELRVRLAGATKSIGISYNKGTWYNLTVSREGSALKIYFDGALVGTYDIGATCDYGTRDLAFGAYYGVSWAYKDANTYFDDIEVYGAALTKDQIKELVTESDDATPVPKVLINYTGGAIANSGANTSITAGAYLMDALKNATKFEATNTASYTTGRSGDANGAIITNHYTGPYTVVKGYPFGTSDFTISTWFKVPTDSEASTGSGTYLMGTGQPDTSTKFAVCLKPTELRVRLAGASKFISVSYEKGNWYNLTVSRQGTAFHVYFNGALAGSYSVAADYDLGTSDIAFGAYHGASFAYKDAITHFDDISVYAESLTKEQIETVIIGK